MTEQEYRYRIKNNIPLDKVFKCKYCGKLVVYDAKHQHYPKYCSRECVVLDRKNNMAPILAKMKQTCLDRYGVDHYTKTQECQDKMKATCIEKYGTDNYFKTKECQEKIRQTNLERYGKEYYTQTEEYKDKTKQTCLNKYGVDSYLKTADKQKKTKESNLKKYGVDHYTKTQECQEKMKATCLNKYGVEHYAKTQECKDKMKATSLKKYGVDHYTKTQECQDKMKATCIEKYGTDSYAKTQEYKDRLDEIQKKINITKVKNGTYTTSKPEEECYKLLLTKFDKDDIIRQYRSKEYPFNCDFYIKSLNLYIEYNGTWTHGWYHNKCLNSFNKSNPEHIKILELYKSKNTKFYKNAIYVWTKLDPLKVETAKKNNLNYKIFWNLEEVKDWLGVL